MDAHLLTLLAALARDSENRRVRASELAQYLGADDLLILRYAAHLAVHLPVFGFPQTLFGGRGWREFADAVMKDSSSVAKLAYPTATQTRVVQGWLAVDMSILVLFDGDPIEERIQMVRSLVPLLTPTFEREKAAIIALGETRIAQQTAQQSQLLADALDSMRNQLQATIVLREKDIAARKRIEAKLERSNTDLKQFASIAAHDLQEPLRSIIAFSQLFSKRYESTLDSQGLQYLDYIIQGGARMRNLIDSLLKYAQVSEAINIEPTDLNGALEAALKDLRWKIDESKAIITREPLPMVLGDKTQLIQLFANLLSNALKYRSEMTPYIHITARRRGIGCVISLQDNGIGISPEYKERIFGLFQRLHTGEYPGTGLGLATCRRIVERFGGTIWVDSELGAGATFNFTLRLAEEDNHSREELLPH